VSSVFQVLKVIVPSMPPVAKTPVCEYSRSWKAKDVMVGGRWGDDGIRSKVVIGRALIVCKQSFILEHVATYPWRQAKKESVKAWLTIDVTHGTFVNSD
jgi:hypothetical protein